MSRKSHVGFKKSSCKTISDFASNTTLHGIQYIFDGAVLFIEKIAWLVICIGFAFLAIYWSIESFHNWKQNPVLTSVKTTGNSQYHKIISYV